MAKNLSHYQMRASFGFGGEDAALPLHTNVSHCLVAAPCVFAARTKTRSAFDNGTGSKGILYGVGVGPGDPELMTLKAVRTIERCEVVAAPRTRDGAMTALAIARGAADLSGKEILPLDFAMTRAAPPRRAAHLAAAAALRARLDEGKSVAFLSLGDVSVYATFGHIADILAPEGYGTEMAPGVPSFCAAAALLGESLTAGMNAPLRVIPDGARDRGFVQDFHAPGTTVWMKAGAALPELLDGIRAAAPRGKLAVVQNCGLPGERVIRGAELADPAAVDPAYFTVVILKNGESEIETETEETA